MESCVLNSRNAAVSYCVILNERAYPPSDIYIYSDIFSLEVPHHENN